MKQVFYTTEKRTGTEIFIGKNIVEDAIKDILTRHLPTSEKLLIFFDEALPEELKSRVFEGFEGYAQAKVEAESVFGGEDIKSLENFLKLIDIIQSYSLKRNDGIIICGGGALSDACNFAASVYMRGIRTVIFPTTFLSMVDASIGGKNAINFRGIKNLIGTFHNPVAIVNELSFLKTLPEIEIFSGLGEVVKTALLEGKELYQKVRNINLRNILECENLDEVVYMCAKFKARVVENDPFETKGEREILNFGHTLGHAIESLNLGRITHGEAVLSGIVLEEWLARDAGKVSEEVFSNVCDIVFSTGLDKKWLNIEPSKLYNYLVFDKKMLSQKEVRFIYIEKPGKSGELRMNVENLIERLERCHVW